MSVYDFAVKCCHIYTEITGVNSKIIRPTVSEDGIKHFVYKTKFSYYKPNHYLKKYLKNFMKRALNDVQTDIYYDLGLNNK